MVTRITATRPCNGAENRLLGSVNAFIELAVYHAGSIAVPRAQRLSENGQQEMDAPVVFNEVGSWSTAR